MKTDQGTAGKEDLSENEKTIGYEYPRVDIDSIRYVEQGNSGNKYSAGNEKTIGYEYRAENETTIGYRYSAN